MAEFFMGTGPVSQREFCGAPVLAGVLGCGACLGNAAHPAHRPPALRPPGEKPPTTETHRHIFLRSSRNTDHGWF